MWTTVNFGKWSGKDKSLPQIIVSDPDWFFWACDEGAFKGALKNEAEKLERRAKAIKLPAHLAANHCVQYVIGTDGKLHGFRIIPTSQPPHVGSSSEKRSPTLDLSEPRKYKGYDKLGAKLLLKTFRYNRFSDNPITKTKAEKFFDDASNFANP